MVELNLERQQQAKAYAQERRRLLGGQLILGAAYLLVWIATGLSFTVRNLVASVASDSLALVAGFFLIFWLAHTILSFPFSLISGWSLPQRYGLSTQTLPQWWGDWLKGEGVTFAFGLLAVEVLFALLRGFPGIWWLAASAVYVVVVVIVAHLGPIFLLPLFFKLKPLPPSELTERLHELARHAGTRIQGIYCLDLSSKTTAANAMLTGLGRTRRVIIGDTLLDCYTPQEIEVVFAHELGHDVHRDIGRGIAEQAIVTLITLYLASLVLGFGAPRLGYPSIADVAVLPFLALVLGVLGMLASPLLNLLSRRAESAADCYALETTHEAGAFANTMIRLANQNLAVFNPPHWVEIFFYDHPPIAERVAMAKNFENTGRCS